MRRDFFVFLISAFGVVDRFPVCLSVFCRLHLSVCVGRPHTLLLVRLVGVQVVHGLGIANQQFLELPFFFSLLHVCHSVDVVIASVVRSTFAVRFLGHNRLSQPFSVGRVVRPGSGLFFQVYLSFTVTVPIDMCRCSVSMIVSSQTSNSSITT